MAKQTRQQRRARREKKTDSTGVVQRARSRQAAVRPAAQVQKQQTGRRETAQRGRFLRESAAELRKVEWPTRSQVIQGTVVVLIACAIVGAYLFAADQVFKRLVQNVLLGQ